MVLQGDMSQPQELQIANYHCHSFFSYKAHGFSPTNIAWLGKEFDTQFMRIVIFKLLNSVDVFLDACEIIGLRGLIGIETRVYVPEYADKEIYSPGEPGGQLPCGHLLFYFSSPKFRSMHA